MSFEDDDTTESHERRITRCRAPGCNAKLIFLKTAAGKHIPVDADTVEAKDEEFDSERHEAHFAKCPGADNFRKKR